MATVALTKDTFTDIVARDGIVLVDWWAGWCGPCRMFAPVFERASDNHPDITFGKVDTEAQLELQARYDIRSIPTIMAIRDGIIVFAQPGMLPEQLLDSLITQVRALDMEQVKAQAGHTH